MKIIIPIVIAVLLPSLASARVNLVKVDKSARKMFLMIDEKIIREYRVALGGNPKGHKQYEGDERTPEGRYTLDYKKDNSSFYRAMHISYPNQQDIHNARSQGKDPGGFIMVHGQRDWSDLPFSAHELKIDWTEGCIAITNSEMDEFMDLVREGTPIHIEW